MAFGGKACFLILLWAYLAHCGELAFEPVQLSRSQDFPNQQQEEQEIQVEEEEQIVQQEVDEGTKTMKKNKTIIDKFELHDPECGKSWFSPSQMNKIVGGRPAVNGQFPWQVYLRIVTEHGEMLCGGSIINSNWILTAAHCISSEQTGQYMASAIEVVAGTLDRGGFGNSARQSRMADCAFKHPGWRGIGGGFANDIALIRLPGHNPLNLNFKNG